ncbi:MAG: LamG domain-containing protein, partial [Caldisericia bacterium]|nr:LamG domain-containing protein [Caldisericia bacterium]
GEPTTGTTTGYLSTTTGEPTTGTTTGYLSTTTGEPTTGTTTGIPPVEEEKGIIEKENSFDLFLKIRESGGIYPEVILNNNETIEGDSSVTESEWHQIILSYNGNNINLYTDGKLNKSVSYSESINSNNNPIFIGKQFYSYLDEVKIYSKGFNQCEVIAHNQRRKYAGGEICEAVNSSVGCLNYQSQYGEGVICKEPYVSSIEVETYSLVP